MKVRLLTDQDSPTGRLLKGMEIEHPYAYLLCELGKAEPVDAAAKKAFAIHQSKQIQQADAQAAADAKRATEHQANQEREAAARRDAFAKRLQT